MANLPEKNVVLVDKITNVPTDSNLFINANGEFKQATVNEVVKSSTVVSTAVETAINTAVQDSIDSNFKQTSGSPILLTDSAEGVLTDFKAYGRSTQDGEPTPDSPIAIKSVADRGYFDGELLANMSTADSTGVIGANNGYVLSKNYIPCNGGNTVKVIYGEVARVIRVSFYDSTKAHISTSYLSNITEFEKVAPTNSAYFLFSISNTNSNITPQTAKPITVTINGKYALIVKSKGKNLLNLNDNSQNASSFTYNSFTNELVEGVAKASSDMFICSYSAYFEKGKTYIFSFDNTSNFQQAYIYSDKLWGNQLSSLQVTSYPYYTHNVDSGVCVIGWYGRAVSGTTYRVSKPMLRLAEVTDGTYEPYKESVTYIPLNEPLRSSLDGSVSDVASLGKCEVTRRIIKKRITQVSKNNSTNANNYCYYAALGNVGKSGVGLSNTLSCVSLSEVTSDGTDNIGMYVTSLYDGVVYINVGKHLTENTVEGMTKWLSENPTYIEYELAEPIIETIEPVDITTYDNVTYLTASDNADMEIEYPTTKVAGIASIGYSKGIKAEYETEQLKKQLLEIQATIVNTL